MKLQLLLKTKFCLLLLISGLYGFASAASANFTTIPQSENGIISICKSQSIIFTNTSTDTDSNTLYNWQFNGGNIQSSTQYGPHTITYNTAGTYVATLTINGNSFYSVTIQVNNYNPSIPQIQLIDGNFWNLSLYNNQSYFTYCSNDALTTGALFSFTTQSTGTNNNSIHTIEWGDGQTNSYAGSNLSDTFHFYSSAGYYTLTYTIQNTGECTSQKTYYLYIGSIPTATISAIGIPTLCNPGSVTYNLLYGAQNTPGTQYIFQVNDGSPPIIFNHPPPSTITHQFLTSSCGSNSTINNTVYPNSYQASITITNPCGNSTNAVGPINIQSAPVANFSRNPINDNICEGTTVTMSDTTQGGYNIGGPPNYICTQSYKRYWVITGPGGSIPVNSTGFINSNPYIATAQNLGYNNAQSNNPGAWLPSAASVINITFLTPGNYTITLYTGSNACGISSISQNICVNPKVTADFTTNSFSICAPAAIQLINQSSDVGCTNTNNYLWNISSSNSLNCPNYIANDWTFVNSNNTSTSPQITFNSPGIYTVSLTTSLNNPTFGSLCTADTETKTITVKGKPTTNVNPTTICEGSQLQLNPTVFNCYATNPVSFHWDFGSNPPSTISSINDPTPTLTFNTPGTYNYTLTISNECGSNSYSSSVTVLPKVNLSASGISATCVNTTIQLNGSITGGVTTGSWTASVNGGTFSPSSTTLNATYTPPVNYIGSITFTLTSDNPTLPCQPISSSFSTIFNTEATVAVGNYPPLCKNSTILLNGTIGGAASSAVWTSSNGGTFSNPNQLNSNFTPPIDYTGSITLTLTTNDPVGPCDPASQSIEINVLPRPILNPISSLVVCNGELVNNVIFTGTDTTGYSWNNSNTLIGLPSSGTGYLNFTAQNTTLTPITSTITVTPINNSGITNCQGTPVNFTITVLPSAQVNNLPAFTTCKNTNTPVFSFSTNNTLGTTSYEWSNNNPSIGLASGGTGFIPSFVTTNTTNAPLVAIINVTPTYIYNGINCTGNSMSFTITILPEAQVNEINPITVCNQTSTTPIYFSTNTTGGTTTYNWSIDQNSLGLPSNGTGAIPSFIPINNSNLPITAMVTVTPFYTLNGVTCSGSNEVFSLTIYPKIEVTPLPNLIICDQTTTNTISFTSNATVGDVVYHWNNNNPSIGLASSGIGPIPSFISTNNSLQPILATLTITPIYTYNNFSCSGSPTTFTITVLPKVLINTISDQTVCSGTSVNFSFSSPNLQGTTSFLWNNDNPNIGLGISGTGDFLQFIGQNNTTTPISGTISVIPTYNYNNQSCVGSPIQFTITINPKGQVNPIPNQIVCNAQSTSAITFSSLNNIGTTTYNWTNSNSSIGLGSSGSGNIPSFTAINLTQSVVTSTVVVTPIFSYNGYNCSGPSETFQISVSPSPNVIFSLGSQTICSGSNSSIVELSSSASNVQFQWTSSNPIGVQGVASNGAQIIPSQQLINNTNTPISVIYHAYANTLDQNACPGQEYTYEITVLPKPQISSTSLLLCSGQSFDYFAINGTPDINTVVPFGTVYTWTISTNPFVSGAFNGSGSSINQTLLNTSSSVQTLIYTIIPSYNNCNGSPFTLTITLLPKPDVLFSISNQVLCNSSNSSAVLFSSSIPGTYQYTWTADVPIGITGALFSGVGNLPSQTLTNTTSNPLTIIYHVQATYENAGYSCTGLESIYEITVNPSILVSSIISDYSGYQISVFGYNNGFIQLTTSGGSSNYTYQWVGPNGFNATTEDISNLAAGNYSVTLSDGICPPIILNFVLTQPNELQASINSTALQAVSCFGGNNGQLGILIDQESVSPYTYELLLNSSVIQTLSNTTILNPIFSNLIAGNYTIKITDANGGIKLIPIVINQPSQLNTTLTSTAISCYGANDASILLTISGGITPYTIQWSNFGTGAFQNNLGPGVYTINITDAQGCSKTIQHTISDLPVFTIQPVINQITCFGAHNGSINLGLVGGQAPVSIVWNDGSISGAIRNNLGPGSYTVTITDLSSCPIIRTFTITEPQPLQLNGIVQNDLNCNTSNQGAIDLVISGGSPPYIINWSNGSTTEDLTGITNGNYAVTVTDSRGCIIQGQYAVFRPAPLVLTLSVNTDVNCQSGQVIHHFEGHVQGGVPPYQINWSNGTVSGTYQEHMSTNQNGLITATVTDSRGCSNSSSYLITNPIFGNATFTSSSYSLIHFDQYSIEDPVQFTNLSQGDIINVNWNFGDGQFSTELHPSHIYLSEGTYTITLHVNYAFGCSDEFSTTITITKGYKLIMPTGFTANGDQINDLFVPAFEGLNNLELSIYDSWGNMIYSEKGENIAGWDGKINSIAAENGNYFYKFTATTFYNKKIEQNGPFVLIK